jgi:predicted  nucleic acid-binding Zn-ribbon protein
MTINKPNTQPKAQVRITCLSTNKIVQFFPYDFEFDDVFRPEWGTYDGFGRMDPVMTYKRTSRTASLSFNVVAESKEDAESNFSNLQTLIQGLYPKYKKPSFVGNTADLQEKKKILDEAITRFGGTTDANPETGQNSEIPGLAESQSIEQQITNINKNATEQNQAINDFGIRVIDRSPLFKINFMNLLNNDEYVIAITNFKHKMKFDAADTSLIDGKAIPGEFNINMSFTILHTDIPGNNLNYDKVFNPPKR